MKVYILFFAAGFNSANAMHRDIIISSSYKEVQKQVAPPTKSDKQKDAISEQLKTLNRILSLANEAKKRLETDPQSYETQYILNNYFGIIQATAKYLSTQDL